MVIYNTTFMLHDSKAEEFLQWIQQCVDEGLCRGSIAACNPRLSTVIEVVGAPDFHEQALSMAFQVEFDSEADAHNWAANKLQPVLEDFTSKFAPDAHSISTLLEAIAL